MPNAKLERLKVLNKEIMMGGEEGAIGAKVSASKEIFKKLSSKAGREMSANESIDCMIEAIEFFSKNQEILRSPYESETPLSLLTDFFINFSQNVTLTSIASPDKTARLIEAIRGFEDMNGINKRLTKLDLLSLATNLFRRDGASRGGKLTNEKHADPLLKEHADFIVDLLRNESPTIASPSRDPKNIFSFLQESGVSLSALSPENKGWIRKMVTFEVFCDVRKVVESHRFKKYVSGEFGVEPDSYLVYLPGDEMKEYEQILLMEKVNKKLEEEKTEEDKSHYDSEDYDDEIFEEAEKRERIKEIIKGSHHDNFTKECARCGVILQSTPRTITVREAPVLVIRKEEEGNSLA